VKWIPDLTPKQVDEIPEDVPEGRQARFSRYYPDDRCYHLDSGGHAWKINRLVGGGYYKIASLW